MQHVPVRKLFWDALTLALETQTHRLARDVAAVLGQPDAPLLKALRDEKVSAYLFDDAEDQEVDDLESFRCEHFTQVGAVLMPCNQPILWGRTGQKACPAHTLNPSPKEAHADLPVLTPLVAEDTTYYVDRAGGTVYTAEGIPCGRLVGETVRLFRIEN